MRKLHMKSVDLPLKHTFKTAHSQRDVQRSIIVSIEERGHMGYGEATVNTYFGVTETQILQGIESVRAIVEYFEWGTPEELHALLSAELKGNTFPLCALDEAAYDLYGKLNGQSTYQYWGLKPHNLPLSNYTIGIDTIANMVAKMEEMPWPVYKIKLGTKEDIDIVRELRKHSDADFRVDANCAWGVEETVKNAAAFREMGVSFVEQPMEPENWEGMKKVYAQSVLPLVADESCIREEDVEKCVGHFHGINIKLTKCGGPTVARRMIEKARQHDMKVMVGCMTESSVGISAIAQLLPMLDYVDMDGSILLKEDPAEGVRLDFGKVIYPERYGNGAHWK
ncbi:dipeptide epimerase [Limibacter armeniacum]|uniref:dipeptide epimerase n=1 Tax=Limibacter armeniacum TaxID=466084 RepID=UPI002FE63E45